VGGAGLLKRGWCCGCRSPDATTETSCSPDAETFNSRSLAPSSATRFKRASMEGSDPGGVAGRAPISRSRVASPRATTASTWCCCGCDGCGCSGCRGLPLSRRPRPPPPLPTCGVCFPLPEEVGELLLVDPSLHATRAALKLRRTRSAALRRGTYLWSSERHQRRGQTHLWSGIASPRERAAHALVEVLYLIVILYSA
jgi:hypothetical protein